MYWPSSYYYYASIKNKFHQGQVVARSSGLADNNNNNNNNENNTNGIKKRRFNRFDQNQPFRPKSNYVKPSQTLAFCFITRAMLTVATSMAY